MYSHSKNAHAEINSRFVYSELCTHRGYAHWVHQVKWSSFKKFFVSLSQVYAVEVSVCICVSVMGWYFVSLTICMLTPWPPVSQNLEMGFLEVIRVRSLHDGISGLTRIGWEISVSPHMYTEKMSHEHTVRRRPSVSQEESLSQNWTMPSPDLRLPARRTVRNTFLLWKPPGLWYSIMAAQAD